MMMLKIYLRQWKHLAPDVVVANEPNLLVMKMKMTTRRRRMGPPSRKRMVCPE
jgi:hypothetical protein